MKIEDMNLEQLHSLREEFRAVSVSTPLVLLWQLAREQKEVQTRMSLQSITGCGGITNPSHAAGCAGKVFGIEWMQKCFENMAEQVDALIQEKEEG